ncbi:MAG: exodeoxyribonuclease VII large subunit, partial [Ruminiclostridium sp.]
AAMEKAQSSGADVIIFGRGGGSIEELWAFNTEKVAMAVYNSKIPTISAVGHETDFTIADFVADLRAPTPSAAAELAVPDKEAIKAGIDSFMERLLKTVKGKLEGAEKSIDFAYKHIKALSPREKIKANSEKLELVEKQIKQRMETLLDSKSASLAAAAEMINALSPLNTIMRGYAIVLKDNSVVKNADELEKGDKITVRMNGGEVRAVVEERTSK